MSRGLSAAFIGAMTDRVIRPAILVQMQFQSGNLNVWTGNGDLTWDAQTWIGAGKLAGISNIEESANLAAKGVTLQIVGTGSGIYDLVMGEKYRYRPVNIWWALVNETFDGVAYSYLMGEYTMDQVSVKDVFGSGGEAGQLITMAAENELADLFRESAAYYTNQDQQALYPGDTFFRFVTTIPGRDVPWGKKIIRVGGTGQGGSSVVGGLPGTGLPGTGVNPGIGTGTTGQGTGDTVAVETDTAVTGTGRPD